jgi:RNA polymerase sigma-70 factor (ECF subfamily)
VNESDLIAHARSGNDAAFTRLVELHQTAIYNLCYRMLGNPSEAEDAAQETFLRAYAQLHRYDSARSFKTWLFAIADHHCIDHLRKRRLTWLSIDEPSLEPHPALREPRPNPEEVSVSREEKAVVEALLSKLTPEDRSVVVMRYWYDLSYEEMAQATGASVSAVKSRLHRARASLANLLVAAPEPFEPVGRSVLAL